MTEGFLQRFPAATVVQLGCGLDTRFQRLDNGRVTWFDLDLSDVIALRRQLLPESQRYRYLASSAFDPGWMDVVSAAGAGPFLFLSEAVLVYFEEARVKDLILTLQHRFAGAELATDAATPLMLRLDNLHLMVTRSAARIRWGLRDPRDVEGWSPGIKLLETFSYFDPPEPRMEFPPWMSRFGPIANGQRILRYLLGPAPGPTA
jgi:O-methyltransferase involved in polyketide biosynthesis